MVIARALAVVISLSCCGLVVAQAAEFKYIKKDTREETRAATLAQYVPQLEWGPWWLIGPFVDAWMKVHPNDRDGAGRARPG